MKYRSRMDITSAILEIAEEGAIKTKIMYRAFLSFPQLKEYLAVLTDQGLLEHSKEERLFFTTEKGRKFLKMYKEVDRMIPQSNMLTKTKM
ncbi:MAG: winged helix-turn-helix domain-containing protein [Nitrososphaera sp.]|uniref:winged helix-turn-helix domain-containing protein n=1 Tax=Nitrososphaera sp. TaxID=1971748 RepID=UPI003D6E5FB8